jgi:GNAT superfamily N-acetyltransferase
VPFVVRPVEISDLQSVAELLVEMDKFYDEPEPESVETKITNMREYVFGAPPSAYLLVAHEENDPTVLGIAAYSFLWPAVGTTRSLYLKELYVRQARRRGGIGRLLMDRLFALAQDSGCSRVEWTTDYNNSDAQGFYSSIGTEPDDGKLFFRSP